GRKRDRIVAGGHTVWPTEVEEVLASHPRVEMAVAIGVLDPLRCSTDIQALVVLGAWVDEQKIEEELLGYCRERLEYFQVPGKITVVDSLLVTPMGKVDRLAVGAEVERLMEERVDLYANQRSGSSTS
ncbi:acyl--CoA ligase, partial [Candidatus Bathyarchaeota archaeon]|nr:acyl--CoA ligase [Candidatus Bathyarchaeota archaeon]